MTFNFDQATIINLKRRPDRRRQILDELTRSDWPFTQPSIMDAIDGNLVQAPEGYKEGNYAWACFQSHRKAVENAIMAGADSLLVLEDDAEFCEDFKPKALQFFEDVPDDWDFIWLGGHHMRDPIPVKPGIVRSVWMDRMHCYGVRGRALKELYRYWHQWHDGHCDWAISQWVARWNSYCSNPWLVGQRGGWSDIIFQNKQPEWWQHSNHPAPQHPIPLPPTAVMTLDQREQQHLNAFPCSFRGERQGVEERNGGCGVAPSPAYACSCPENSKKKASLWRFCTQQDIPICMGCPWNKDDIPIYPRLSACFPVSHDIPRTLKTIERFYETTKGLDVEMIVVCPPTAIMHQLNQLHYHNMKVIINEGNLAIGYSLAATLATGFFLMKWNDSLAPQPGWLKEAYNTWNKSGAPQTCYMGLNDESEGFPNSRFNVAFGTKEFYKTLMGGSIHVPYYERHDEQEAFDIATSNQVAFYSNAAKMMYVPSDRPDTSLESDRGVYEKRKEQGFKHNYPAVLK